MVTKDNVFVFRKHTPKSLGIKGHHVYNLNTTRIVQDIYVYAERGNREVRVAGLSHVGIWAKGIWDLLVLFLHLFYKSEVTSM